MLSSYQLQIYLSKEFKIATNITLYITLEMEVGPIFVAFKKWLEFWEKVRIERNKVVTVRQKVTVTF